MTVFYVFCEVKYIVKINFTFNLATKFFKFCIYVHDLHYISIEQDCSGSGVIIYHPQVSYLCCKKMFYQKTCPFVYVLSVAPSLLQKQSWYLQQRLYDPWA